MSQGAETIMDLVAAICARPLYDGSPQSPNIDAQIDRVARKSAALLADIRSRPDVSPAKET